MSLFEHFSPVATLKRSKEFKALEELYEDMYKIPSKDLREQAKLLLGRLQFDTADRNREVMKLMDGLLEVSRKRSGIPHVESIASKVQEGLRNFLQPVIQEFQSSEPQTKEEVTDFNAVAKFVEELHYNFASLFPNKVARENKELWDKRAEENNALREVIMRRIVLIYHDSPTYEGVYAKNNIRCQVDALSKGQIDAMRKGPDFCEL